MKKFISSIGYSFISLVLVFAIFLNNAPTVVAEDLKNDTTNRYVYEHDTPSSRSARSTDTILACGWVKEYNDTQHWDRCINHNDTGEYNGVQHIEGKLNKQNHNLIRSVQPTCVREGKDYCTGCGFTRVIPKLAHSLTGTWLPQWYYHKDRQYCTSCNDNIVIRNCTYVWYTIPTTYQSGVGRCTASACNREVTIPPLPSTCSRGGQHDFHNREFVPYDTENCGLSCTKCNQIIRIQEHNHSEGCRFCGGWDTNGTVRILAKENGAGKTPRIKVGIWTSPAYGCVNGSTGETQFYGYDKNGGLPYLLPNQNVTFYNGYGEIWIQAQNVEVWGKLFVYSNPQGKYGRSGFYANSGEQNIDDSPPTISQASITPKNPVNGYSNIGTLSVTAIDLQSGDCQVAIYDGSSCVKDWTPMTKSGDTYTASVDFYGDFTIARNLTVKVKDKNNVVGQTVALARNIENVAPSLNLSIKNIGFETATIVVTADDGAGSGVNRIKLPNGTFVNSSYVEYKVSTNNSYTFRVEDNIGNARTKSINISNIIDYVSVEVTYDDFIIDSNGFRESKIAFKNNSSVSVKVTLEEIKSMQSDFIVVPYNKFTQSEWNNLGLTDSKQYIALGLKKDGVVNWLDTKTKYDIILKPNETITYSVVGKTGLSFNSEHHISYEFKFAVTGVN
jgi:hypothetical protein